LVIKRNFHCVLPRGLSTQSGQNDLFLLFSAGNAYNKGLDANSHEGSQVMSLRHTSTASGHVAVRGPDKVAPSA